MTAILVLMPRDLVQIDPADPARVTIAINHDRPLELVELTVALAGIAREYETHARLLIQNIGDGDAKLYVVDIRKGSIILDLVAYLQHFAQATNAVKAAVELVGAVKRVLSRAKQSAEVRQPDEPTQRLKNVEDIVRLLANSPGSSMVVAARSSDANGAVEEFYIDNREAKVALASLEGERHERSQPEKPEVFEKVLLRLVQTSIADAKLGKRAQEKGIIESVSPRALPLIYVSDLAAERIKAAIRDEDSAYFKGFVVDVTVERVQGKPRAYRVLALDDVIDLSD